MTETILEPDLPIIDPHHHLWIRPNYASPPSAPAGPQHGFTQVTDKTPRYLIEELLADINTGHNVLGTVFVQCGSMYRAEAEPAFKPVGETEFVNGVAAMSASGIFGPSRLCNGIVGHVDLTLGDVIGDVLEAHLETSDRFRGIRHSCSWDADPDVLGPLGRIPGGLYASSAFREGFARFAKFGLTFDAWLLEPQLPELIDLVRAFPDQSFILDHVGTPLGLASYAGKREERFATWRANMRKLAEMPNVNVKLGGLAMAFCNFPSFLSDPPAPSTQLAAEWTPYIEACIEDFGAERCMFESNFPVDLGSCSYPVLWNAFKHIAKDYAADEKAALFAGTARRVYSLTI